MPHRSKLSGSNRYYGWHRSPPSEADVVYAVSPEAAATLPDAVDLSQPELPSPWSPVFDQGPIGSCGPNSISGDLIFSALKQEHLPAAKMPSRLFIYFNARRLMGTVGQDSGVQNRALVESLKQFGWCDEELCPYLPAAFKQSPSDDAYAQAATRKIPQHYQVNQDMDSMRAALANGDTFVFGFNVYSSMEGQSATRTGVVPMPTAFEQSVGGHDVLFVGYNFGSRMFGDIPSGYFKFRNSWGPQWGANGYGFMPARYALNPQMAGDFRTIRNSGLPIAPSPSPQPSPAPAPAPPLPGAGTVVISGRDLRVLVNGKPVT